MKAAVIGLGPHERRIVDAIGRFPQVELAGVVDRRSDALEYEKLPTTTARLESTEKLWAVGNIDLACVATNGPSHAALAGKAIAAGSSR